MAQGSSDAHEAVVRWRDFLRDYASGNVPDEGFPPTPGALPDEDQPSFEFNPEVPLYPPDDDTITEDVARDVARFYTQHRFLPPPRSLHSKLRDRLILEYDLFQKDQVRRVFQLESFFLVDFCCSFKISTGSPDLLAPSLAFRIL